MKRVLNFMRNTKLAHILVWLIYYNSLIPGSDKLDAVLLQCKDLTWYKMHVALDWVFPEAILKHGQYKVWLEFLLCTYLHFL